MTFGEAVKSCFHNYASFKGRAGRSEYWFFALFVFLISIAVEVSVVLFDQSTVTVSGIVTGLFFFLPSQAVCVRRLHDVGKSGKILLVYYLLSLLTAVIGSLYAAGRMGGAAVIILVFLCIGLLVMGVMLFVFVCRDSDSGENEYGPNPKSLPKALK